MRDKFTLKRVEQYMGVIKDTIRQNCIRVDGILMQEGKEDRGTWHPFDSMSYWGRNDSWYRFKVALSIPSDWQGQCVRGVLKTGREGWNALNPQFLLRRNGQVVQALDTNHQTFLLSSCAEGGEDYELEFEAYSGREIGNTVTFQDVPLQFDLRIYCHQNLAEKTYYDLYAAWHAAKIYPPTDYRRIQIENYMIEAINKIDLRQPGSEVYFASLREASDYLWREFYGKFCGNESVIANCVGHTHIDVAWLWTLEQTRSKALRSFATELALMEEYKEHHFSSSQPQLYQFVKEASPEVYEKIKKQVENGAWEVEGAMWLEADCNLTSGESLIRQILHGKRFMKEEFNVDSHILWLPDVFGYSAAMPQILKKTGVDTFVTSKIHWNESNHFPYDTFIWRGIDGSEVFTQFITAGDPDVALGDGNQFSSYNAQILPIAMAKGWEIYQQKEINNEILVSFGYGDGGGGVSREMLEMQKRLSTGIPGTPKTRLTTINDAISRIKSNVKGKKIPHWHGELYLELHRGTYTSQARNKRYNRYSEFLLAQVETAGILAKHLLGYPYPKDELYADWTTILLNQFHDIIPGSSIREVYEESHRQYETLIAANEARLAECLHALAAHVAEGKVEGDALAIHVAGKKAEESALTSYDEGESAEKDALAAPVESKAIFVYNPTGIRRDGIVSVDGSRYFVRDVPAFGWKMYKEEQGGDLKNSGSGKAGGMLCIRSVNDVTREDMGDIAEEVTGEGKADISEGLVEVDKEEISEKLAGLIKEDISKSLPEEGKEEISEKLVGLIKEDISKSLPEEGKEEISKELVGGKDEIIEMENDFFLLRIDASGAITSIYDKRQEREVLSGRANVLEAYDDHPHEWDNWELNAYHRESRWEIDDVQEIRQEMDQVSATVIIRRRFLDSTFTQKIILYRDMPRIDFDFEADWHQHHIFVKTAFPVDILADKATFEIQYGAVERPTHTNTSWDAARFEVCAQKWVDYAEYGYGVALLNDCKYGHDIHDGIMRLSLIKCGTYPDPMADQGYHHARYSLVPHAGNWQESGIARQAYAFNCPLVGIGVGGAGKMKTIDANLKIRDESLKTEDESLKLGCESLKIEDESLKLEGERLKTRCESHKTEVEKLKLEGESLKLGDQGKEEEKKSNIRLPQEFSLFHTDSPDIIITVAKEACDSEKIVFRAYEAHGRRTRATFHLGIPATKVEERDMLETEILQEISLKGFHFESAFKPFEIKTYVVTL